MTTRMIAIASIDAGERLRTIDPAWVALLAEEIGVDGLLEPIRVVERGDRFLLVSGARRLAAHIQLGRDAIAASVDAAETLADATAVQLAEIKADMLRGELTALDHAVYIAAWCEIYRAAQGPLKRGPKASTQKADEELEELSAKLALNWSEAAQQALQISRRTVFRSLKVSAIDVGLRSRIALLPVANNQREILVLAEQKPALQAAIVDLLTADPAKAESVTDAIALLSGSPTVVDLSPAERLSQRFATLKQGEQEAFFTLHADAIERWMAVRLSASAKKIAA